MEIEGIIISASVTIFSLGLLIVSLSSYRKFKNSKLIFISLAFLVFLIRGITMSFGLFYGEIASFTSSIYMGLFDLATLIFLFIATLKR